MPRSQVVTLERIFTDESNRSDPAVPLVRDEPMQCAVFAVECEFPPITIAPDTFTTLLVLPITIGLTAFDELLDSPNTTAPEHALTVFEYPTIIDVRDVGSTTESAPIAIQFKPPASVVLLPIMTF